MSKIKLIKNTKYIATPPMQSFTEACINSMTWAFPNTIMIYDGKWCKFFKEDKEVFDSNPAYAQNYFKLELQK